MTSVELFAGAGGLALGVSKAGFSHKAVVEIDKDAYDTIRANQERGIQSVKDWPLFEADVRKFAFDECGTDIDLLAAGVPCQPWSMGGKHRGYDDERNMFPETIRAVLVLRPKAILIENVKGLTRQSFARSRRPSCWDRDAPNLGHFTLNRNSRSIVSSRQRNVFTIGNRGDRAL